MRIVKDRDERSEEILMGASELFLSNGFDKTTVDDIVHKLGISKGLVFYYYKTKEELVGAVIERLATHVASPVIAIIESDVNFCLKITKILRHFSQFALQFKGKFQNMIQSNGLRVLGRFRETVFKKITPYLADLTRQGLSEGSITNIDAENSMIIVAVGGITQITMRAGDSNFDVDKFLHSVVNTLEMALGMKKGSIGIYFEGTKNFLPIN